MTAPLANVHGEILPLDEVKVSVQDRGFLFGDAVYEVLRLYQGRASRRGAFQALENSLAAIRIAGVDLDRLRRRLHETVAAGNFTEAMAYIHVTRGAAAPPCLPGTPPHLSFCTCRTTTTAPRPRLVSRAPRSSRIPIFAGAAAISNRRTCSPTYSPTRPPRSRATETLLYLADESVSEASHSSYFTVEGATLCTTPLKANILPGITRNFLIRLAQQAGIHVSEQTIYRADLFKMDEIF